MLEANSVFFKICLFVDWVHIFLCLSLFLSTSLPSFNLKLLTSHLLPPRRPHTEQEYCVFLHIWCILLVIFLNYFFIFLKDISNKKALGRAAAAANTSWRERASVRWRDRGQVENYSKELFFFFRGLDEEKIEKNCKRETRRTLPEVMAVQPGGNSPNESRHINTNLQQSKKLKIKLLMDVRIK